MAGGWVDISAHKIEVDFNLLRGVLTAFPGALMDKDFLNKLIQHGVRQRVEVSVFGWIWNYSRPVTHRLGSGARTVG